MIRSKLWEEMKHAKAMSICAQLYTDKKRKWNRYNDWIIMGVSSIGAGGFFINENITIISTFIIAIISIIRQLLPLLIQPESELHEIDQLNLFYEKYFIELEKLWYKSESGNISEAKTLNALNNLQIEECSQKNKYNKLVRKISKKLQSKTDKAVDEYLKRIYYQ